MLHKAIQISMTFKDFPGFQAPYEPCQTVGHVTTERLYVNLMWWVTFLVSSVGSVHLPKDKGFQIQLLLSRRHYLLEGISHLKINYFRCQCRVNWNAKWCTMPVQSPDFIFSFMFNINISLGSNHLCSHCWQTEFAYRAPARFLHFRGSTSMPLLPPLFALPHNYPLHTCFEIPALQMLFLSNFMVRK